MTMHYIPLYTGDYIRDTRHLSPMKHGIYLLLLMYCWDKHGLAPLDETELSCICNARTKEEMEAVRQVLREFFIQSKEGWYNPRLVKELEHATHAYNKKVKAASKARSHKRSVVSNVDNNLDNKVDSNVVLPLTRARSRSISIEDPERESNQERPSLSNLPQKYREIAKETRADLLLEQIEHAAKKYDIHHEGKHFTSHEKRTRWKEWIFDEDPNKGGNGRTKKDNGKAHFTPMTAEEIEQQIIEGGRQHGRV